MHRSSCFVCPRPSSFQAFEEEKARKAAALERARRRGHRWFVWLVSAHLRGLHLKVQGSCATQLLYPDLDRRVSGRFWPGRGHQLTSGKESIQYLPMQGSLSTEPLGPTFHKFEVSAQGLRREPGSPSPGPAGERVHYNGCLDSHDGFKGHGMPGLHFSRECSGTVAVAHIAVVRESSYDHSNASGKTDTYSSRYLKRTTQFQAVLLFLGPAWP